MIAASKLSITTACKTVGMPRASYYRRRQQSKAISEAKIVSAIEEIVLEYTRYGYRRVTAELRRRGTHVNRKRVCRIMREKGWACKPKRFRIATTDSNHQLPTYGNLAKHLKPTGINQLWVADITYVLLPHGQVYLAVILDVFSRRCIGWDLGNRIDTTLALNALEMAISQRKHYGLAGLIHHSDQGVQYASSEYVAMLNAFGIQPSMSRKANPYDNAFAESFMKTLKSEEVYVKDYADMNEARENIKQFIEVVYNNKRLHSSIGYLPPVEFESMVLNRIVR